MLTNRLWRTEQYGYNCGPMMLASNRQVCMPILRVNNVPSYNLSNYLYSTI